MFDFQRILRDSARALPGGRFVLAALYDLPERFFAALVAQGVISGYLRSEAPYRADFDHRIAGWWVNREKKEWFLRRMETSTIVILGGGRDQEIGGRMLLEARIKGFRHIRMVDKDGNVAAEIDVSRALLRRLGESRTSCQQGELSYKAAYEEMVSLVGAKLSLSAGEIVPNRVLLLVGSLGPGGAERQAAYTALGLARRAHHEVYIGCNHLDPPADFFSPIVQAAGIKPLLVPCRSSAYDAPEIVEIRNRLARFDALNMQNIFDAIFHYALLIRNVRPSLVHTWMDYTNVLGGLAAELAGIPKLVFSGRSVAPDNFPYIFQPYMHPGYDFILRRREVVLLNNSWFGAIDYARWLNLAKDRIRVIHNGFDFPKLFSQTERIALREMFDLPKEAIVIGSITRFAEEKRPQLFVDIARIVHDKYPNVRFLACGTGMQFDQISAEVVASGLSGIVKLPGVVNSWAALATMDIFVLPSRVEGLPNALIEAQAFGVPIVCTAVGGMRETYLEGETGFGVPEATPEALAAAVSRLIVDVQLRQKVSEQAFRYARNAFQMQRMVDDTFEAYHQARALGCSDSG
jgi:glycosyltransferase involved in cell wall biosynthesis